MDKPLMLAEIPSFICSDGQLDLPAVAAAVRRLIQAGYDALLVAGPAGEYASLTLPEQAHLIACVLEAAEGKARIFAGALEAGTDKAALRIAEHASLGCHGHVCLPAHYFTFRNPGELLAHFRALAETDGGVVILDSPQHVGYALPEDMRMQLLDLPGIEGVVALRSLQTGWEGEPETALIRPGDGRISRTAFLFPYLCRCERLSDAVRYTLQRLLTVHAHPAAVIKHAAQYLHLCRSGCVLPPAPGLSERDKRDVETYCTLLAQEERLLHE